MNISNTNDAGSLPLARLAAARSAVAAVFGERVARTAPWGFAKRVGFRFLFLYLVFVFFPSPLDSIPGVSILARPYGRLWELAATWVGHHVFRLAEIPTERTGSGDTAESWLLTLCAATLALAGTVVWSLLARSAKDHTRLHAGLRVWLRYLLATALLGYGAAKLTRLQFPAPGLEDLLETYGESSPMHLLWTFMGASGPYTIFGGAAEAVGAVLLVWRRTATLGALVLAGVMTNVVMLNFCYDVPVKLYSSELLLMALVLAAPDLRRLANLLVLGRAADAPAARVPGPLWAERTRIGVKAGFLACALFVVVWGSIENAKQWGPGAPRPTLYGIYDVESFTRGGVEVPPLLTDAKRWKTVLFNEYPIVSFYGVGGERHRYMEENDEAKATLTLTSQKSGTLSLTYARPDPEHLTLEGTIDGERVAVRLARAKDAQFDLTHRGFHWVSEYPANW